MHSADRDVVRGSGQFEFFIDPYEDCRPEAALDKCAQPPTAPTVPAAAVVSC